MVNADTFFIAPLSWADNTTNEDGYIIYRTVQGNTTIVDTVAANVTSYTDTVLIFGKQIQYRVRAYRGTMVSAPSNMVSYAMPGKFERLDLTFVCYDPGTNMLTWNVFNPNTQYLPFIWAQWWSNARDTLFAAPGASVQFQTVNVPQNSSTFGDDNSTGIWWADQRLLPGKPSDIVYMAPLTTTCGGLRQAAAPAAKAAGTFFKGTLARSISEAQFEQEFLEQAFTVSPNPATDLIRLEAPGLEGNASIRITNLAGQVVLIREADFSQAAEIRLSQMPAGIYLVTLSTGNASISRRVVKQ
ncbi:MAG: T9SS type A sorting domain-containing protein [Bacteroidia bacterium]|nr:T9SS type A sorting domain-containing protein [Bacteroidia bacterium]